MAAPSLPKPPYNNLVEVMDEDIPQRLFRGVNTERFAKDQGLSPHKPGAQFSSVAGCGEDHARCGSGIICGDAATNTVVAHQWKGTGVFPEGTSGVSTTPHFEQARKYALHDGRYSAGKVIEVDSMELRRLGVHVFRVKHIVPALAVFVPEDDECLLVADDFGAIPTSAVVQIHDVSLSAP